MDIQAVHRAETARSMLLNLEHRSPCRASRSSCRKEDGLMLPQK